MLSAARARRIEAEKRPGEARQANGKVVMATVKGDVHDIGKNIVGVVLQCNNHEVVDLGVMVLAAKIRDEARRLGADEMTRQGFTLPLLIGGATTSKVHTAVKIAPNYHGPVVYVADASRAVGVAGALLSAEQRDGFVAEVGREYERIRVAHNAAQMAKVRLPLAQARANKAALDWAAYAPPAPLKPGLTVFEDYDLAELVTRIDWKPFFQAWELAGNFPAILEDPVVGAAATSLYNDAQAPVPNYDPGVADVAAA